MKRTWMKMERRFWGQYVLKVEGGMREIEGGGNTTMKPDIVYAL